MDFSQRQLGLLAALAILAGGLALAPQSPLSGVTGGTTIEYDSNGEFFNGEVLSIEYTGSTTADSIRATYTAEELSAGIEEQTEQDVEISVDNINSKATYRLQDNNEPPLRKVRVENQAVAGSQFADPAQKAKFDAKNNGLDLDDDGEVTVLMPGEDPDGYFEAIVIRNPRAFQSDRWISYYYTNPPGLDLGGVSDISSPNKEISAEWTIDVEGEPPVTKTISNSDIGAGQTTRISDNIIIEWAGNRDSGIEPPNTDDEFALVDDGDFSLISRGNYQQYRTFLRNDAPRLLAGVVRYDADRFTGVEEKTFFEAYDTFNEEAEFAASPYNADSDLSEAEFENGELTLDTKKDFQYPTFQVYIKGGDYFSVEKTVATPEIVDVSRTPISEVGGGEITVTARNEGNAEGNLNARITSEDSNFDPTSVSRTETLEAGETTEFNFDTGFESSNNQKRVDGDFEIELTNAEGTRVSQTVEVEGVQRNECQPGTKIVDTQQRDGDPQLEEVVIQCDSEGLTKTEVLVCGDDRGESHSAVERNGEYVCEEQPQDTEVCGNGVDDDGDGKVDENCGKQGNCQITLFEAPTGQTIQVTNPLCAVQNAVDNALGNTLGLFDLIVSSVAGIVGFGLASRDLGDFVAPTFSEATRLGESQVRLGLGLVALVAVGYLTFTVISSIFVKIALIIGGIAYAYIKSLIPGV